MSSAKCRTSGGPLNSTKFILALLVKKQKARNFKRNFGHFGVQLHSVLDIIKYSKLIIFVNREKLANIK
jgi:hypothetical protein